MLGLVVFPPQIKFNSIWDLVGHQQTGSDKFLHRKELTGNLKDVQQKIHQEPMGRKRTFVCVAGCIITVLGFKYYSVDKMKS